MLQIHLPHVTVARDAETLQCLCLGAENQPLGIRAVDLNNREVVDEIEKTLSLFKEKQPEYNPKFLYTLPSISNDTSLIKEIENKQSLEIKNIFSEEDDSFVRIKGIASEKIRNKEHCVNLLPEEWEKRWFLKRKKPFFLAAVSCIIASCLILGFGFKASYQRYNIGNKTLQGQLQLIAKRAHVIQKLQADSEEILAKLHKIQATLTSGRSWTNFLETLEKEIEANEGLGIDTLEITEVPNNAILLTHDINNGSNDQFIKLHGWIERVTDGVSLTLKQQRAKAQKLINAILENGPVSLQTGIQLKQTKSSLPRFSVTLKKGNNAS